MLGVRTPALPASLRRTNERTVVSLLLRLGSASRADLAKAAGISQPTAGKITTELLQLGILQEVGSAAAEGNSNGNHGAPRLGRPGQLLRLESRRPRFLAIELGVTETSVSALPVAVKLQDEWACSFPTAQSPEAWIKDLKAVAAKVANPQLWGVLISVPGIVDDTAGKVLFSPNLHWLAKADLPQLVGQLWDLPVLLVQEIRALALGHLTAEPGGEDFFLVDFGQGVGGAIVLEGKLYSQPMPLSGEFGHTPVVGNQRRCGCGAIGCLETLVSERGLLESFAAHSGVRNSEFGGRNANGSSPHSAFPTPRSALRTGDKFPTWPALVQHVTEHGVEPWLADTLEATAKVIAGALNVLGIQRVVVTGRLTELPGVVEQLGSGIQQGAMWARFGAVACQSAPHRRAAGLVALGLDRLVLPAEEEAGNPKSEIRNPKQSGMDGKE